MEQIPFQAGERIAVLVMARPLLRTESRFSPVNWPALQGGWFLGIPVSREVMYDDAR